MIATNTSIASSQRRAVRPSHAIPAAPAAMIAPTTQMRHAARWIPAVKVPSANRMRAASAVSSALTVRVTSITNIRCIAMMTATQCQACRQAIRMRSSRLASARQRVRTQIAPINGATAIQ